MGTFFYNKGSWLGLKDRSTGKSLKKIFEEVIKGAFTMTSLDCQGQDTECSLRLMILPNAGHTLCDFFGPF